MKVTIIISKLEGLKKSQKTEKDKQIIQSTIDYLKSIEDKDDGKAFQKFGKKLVETFAKTSVSETTKEVFELLMEHFGRGG